VTVSTSTVNVWPATNSATSRSAKEQRIRGHKPLEPKTKTKTKDATAIARQRRSQRLTTAREPDLQARFLELTSWNRSRRGCSRGGCRGHCRGGGGGGGSSVALAERLFLGRLLRAFLPVGFDLRLDCSTSPLVVFLFWMGRIDVASSHHLSNGND